MILLLFLKKIIMDKKFLLQEILAHKIVEISWEEPLVVSEGVVAPVCFYTKRIPYKNVELRNNIVKAMAAVVQTFVRDTNVILAAATTDAEPLASVVANQLGLKCIYLQGVGAGENKVYSFDKAAVKNQNVIVIDSAVTTNLSRLPEIAVIENYGGQIKAICALFNFEFAATLNFSSIPFCSILTFSDLLEEVTAEQRQVLIHWHNNPSCWHG